jgi:hypothetical protein
MDFVWPTLVRLLSLPGALNHNKDAASARDLPAGLIWRSQSEGAVFQTATASGRRLL